MVSMGGRKCSVNLPRKHPFPQAQRRRRVNKPLEYRIVTALLIGPMSVKDLAISLGENAVRVMHAVQYLRKNELEIASYRSPCTYRLNQQGREWAQEIVK
jgi:hypothetical protein